MAVTQGSDVFVPQVVADLTTDILFESTLLINSPYVVDGTPNVYVDGGDTLTFPSWTTTKSGLIQDQVTGRTGVDPSKITMGTYTESVNDKIISFDANKNAFSSILASANPNQHMAELVASESQLEIQRHLIDRAEGTPLVIQSQYAHASTNLLTVDSILEAKQVWGEKASGLTPGLFVHSKQFTDLAKSDDFKTLGTATTNNAIVNAQAAQGAVAMVHGVMIYQLDSITKREPTVSSITRSGTTATVTTAAAHGYRVGDQVVVSGATQTEYNVTAEITTVPTSTTFTYEVAGSPATTATGSPVIAASYEALMLMPGALMLVIKQALEATEHLHPGSPVRTYDFDFRYAGTLLRVNPRRAVRFRTR